MSGEPNQRRGRALLPMRVVALPKRWGGLHLGLELVEGGLVAAIGAVQLSYLIIA